MESLQLFDASGNNLQGTIPRSLGRLKKLRDLELDDNFLTGTIPAELADCESLIGESVHAYTADLT